jgi:phospholipid/cholesterol/gamma-HCH transport system permease protein
MGTDPTRKLVTPRVVATVLMLPLLTIVADFVGLVGGFLVAFFEIHLSPVQFWTRAVSVLEFKDLVQGMAKPFLFGFIVSSIGCYYGLTTRGGTQGVGRSTTEAVVTSSVLVLISDFFVTKFLLWALEH